MNFLTKIRAITDLNNKELKLGYVNTAASWHAQYKHSAWIHVGGLSYKLSEGDVICVFSQYGEIVQIHMPRDRETGKTKGFAFLCYEDTRSTVLAVDNLNGSKVCDRQIKVDHVLDFKPPKDSDDDDDDDDRVGMAKDYRRRKRGYQKKRRYKRFEKDIDGITIGNFFSKISNLLFMATPKTLNTTTKPAKFENKALPLNSKHRKRIKRRKRKRKNPRRSILMTICYLTKEKVSNPVIFLQKKKN